MNNFKQQEGFTLVELMIVVAIIGILAAIAIPQFAAYRARSFNSSAVSDIRGLATSQATFFGDNNLYGVTGSVAATALNTPAAALIAGPGVATTALRQWARGAARMLQIPLGNGVTIYSVTDAAALSFTGVTKHQNGQNWYAVDSDTSTVYVAIGVPTDQNLTTVIADIPVSTVGGDDVLAALVSQGSTPPYVAM